MTPILAVGFTSYAMLGWLGAAALPLVIHLLSRRRYRETSWAAMEYLLAAVRRQRRRIRIEQWLLLAVRTLLVMLVVLAVAEPFLQRAGLAVSLGEPTHRVMVLDGSFSMGYRPTDRTRFDQAKEWIARIVEESRQGDGFTLVLLSAPPRAVVHRPVFAPRDFLAEVENLKLPHGTADLPATLALVERLLGDARREYPRLTREEVYFLTDLGRASWMPSAAGPAADAEFQQRAQRLAAATLTVVDVGQPQAENAAITGLRAMPAIARAGRDVTLQVELANFGRQALTRQTVQLLVGGQPVKEQRVELPAGSETSLALSHRFDAPGEQLVEVRLQADALDLDNHRWLVMRVKPALEALVIDGRPRAGTGGAAYLEMALAPGEGGPAGVRVQVAPESALVESELARYDCIFLADVAQFTAQEARVLNAYLAGGGGLVFFLGDQVQAERYNQELGGGRPGAPALLPARLGETVDRPQDRLDPLEYAHPMVAAFRGRPRAGLLTALVMKYVRLSLPERSHARVVLRLGNGDPLIVEHPVGRGRVVLVATSADTAWTAMPLMPVFPPLVHEILGFAASGSAGPEPSLVGQSIGGVVRGPGGGTIDVETPDARRESVPVVDQGDYGAWTYGDTWTSGIYAARAADAGPPERFAVNVDPLESDLASLSREQFLEEVWPGVPVSFNTAPVEAAGPATAGSGRQSPLATELLYGALALLLAETWLARRFGYHGP